MTEERGQSDGKIVASFKETFSSGRGWACGFRSTRPCASPSPVLEMPHSPPGSSRREGDSAGAKLRAGGRSAGSASGFLPKHCGSGCLPHSRSTGRPLVPCNQVTGTLPLPGCPTHLCFRCFQIVAVWPDISSSAGGVCGQASRSPAPPALTDPAGVSPPKPP